MTAATVGRIDIDGQGGGYSQELRISRSLPATLENRMNKTVWNNFCDEVDEALEPVNVGKKRLMTIMMVYGIFDIIMIILSFALFFSSFNDSGRDSSSSHSSSSSSGVASFIPFILAVLSCFVMIPVMTCWASKFSNQGLEDLRMVCDKATARNSGISFHVRDEQQLRTQGGDVRASTRNFIEVCVSNDGMAGTALPTETEIQSAPVVKATVIGPVAASSPAFNPAAAGGPPELDIESGAGKKCAANRMRALEEMKGLLTEEEYQRKRAEILSDV